MKAATFSFCLLLAIGSTAVQAGQPVISLSIGGEISPGVYGHVEFGNAPPPAVVYPEPVVIVPPKPNRSLAPIYLHVPPGHAKDWARYCGRYDACNRPVYFVRSREYDPGYSERKDKKHKNEGTRHGHNHEGHGDQWHDERR